MIDAGAFRAALKAPELIRLFDYWQSLRGERPMPAWADIKPEEIAPVLPRIWAWRLAPDGNLHLRLVGEKILEVLRRNVRGSAPEDLYPADEAAAIRARLLKVARLPACSHTFGDMFLGAERIGTGERIALPYADVGGGLGVIGASKATPGIDTRTGLEIPFDPKALYTLIGPERFMTIE